ERLSLAQLIEKSRQRALGLDPAAKIEAQVEPELAVEADEPLLSRALDNLLDNARKYGGGSPLEVTARRDGAEAALAVRARGPGASGARTSRSAGRTKPSALMCSSSDTSGAQYPPVSSTPMGFSCSPSCPQVIASNSSSSVPHPPGSATTASLSADITALRSCSDDTMRSSVSPWCATSREVNARGSTPTTSAPPASAASAHAPISPSEAPP